MTVQKAHEATHEGNLEIGDTLIPSAVLEDGTRVITSKGFLTALGRPWKGASRTDLPNFIGAKNLKPFVSKELHDGLNPIKYVGLRGALVNGYKAEILPLICDVYLKAREDGKITQRQEPVAKQAEILVRSLSKVGIIALVDEATGYQDTRIKNALVKILEKFITDEYREWSKTFPDEFYREMFRLKGWQWNPKSVKRPQIIGRYTNDIVYDRLAPGVLDALRRKNPTTLKGYRKHKHHQWLTGDVGNPALKGHLEGTMALMRAAPNWRRFTEMLNRAYPKYGENIALALEFDESD